MASDMIAPCQHSELLITPVMESSAIASSSSVAVEAASASGTSNAVVDDCLEDGCSICLEPFTSTDPSTVTSCKHEYHLQCILEWSQRSKECPVCWQLFVLKDPASQELLAAVEGERIIRSRSNIRHVNQEHEVNYDVPSVDESDFEEGILRHFTAAKSIAQLVKRRRQSSPGLGPSRMFPSMSVVNSSNHQIHNSPEENRNLRYGVEVGLPASVAPPSSIGPVLKPERRDGPANHWIFSGQTSPDGPQKSSSSELLAFSESVKAKLSAASSKYKESFSKSTHGFKERLLARNSSVRELSRGVQREMSAGMAGVARMIERFDLSSKRTGDRVPLSDYLVETSDLKVKSKGKEVEQGTTTQPLPALSGGTTKDRISSGVSVPNSRAIPGQVEVSCTQNLSRSNTDQLA